MKTKFIITVLGLLLGITSISCEPDDVSNLKDTHFATGDEPDDPAEPDEDD